MHRRVYVYTHIRAPIRVYDDVRRQLFLCTIVRYFRTCPSSGGHPPRSLAVSPRNRFSRLHNNSQRTRNISSHAEDTVKTSCCDDPDGEPLARWVSFGPYDRQRNCATADRQCESCARNNARSRRRVFSPREIQYCALGT